MQRALLTWMRRLPAAGVFALGAATIIGCHNSDPPADRGDAQVAPDAARDGIAGTTGSGGRPAIPSGTGGVTRGSGGAIGSGGARTSGSGGAISGTGGKTGTGGTPSGTGGSVATGSGGSAGTSPPFTFLAWGDTKSATDVLSSLSDQAAALRPAFTLYAGDLTESYSDSLLDDWFVALDGELTGTTSPNGIAALTFPVRGNHDNNLDAFQRYMATNHPPSAVAARAGATHFESMPGNEQVVYSFDYGNSHFVGLDVEGDAFDLPSDQIAWLDSNLAAAEARGQHHAFIFFHGPIYCAAGHCCTTTTTPAVCDSGGVIASLLAVLDKHPIVTATFHGHEHVYSYTYLTSARIPTLKRGFRHFITGDAGAGPEPCDAARVDYCMSNHGFITMKVDGTNVTVTWYRQGSTTPQHTLTFSK